MDNGINARQEALKLTLPGCVIVVGCGGVGSWVAYMLALAGVPKLWLFDSDTLSEHNLNRIPLPLSAVGKKKSVAMAELIRSLRPKCEVMPVGAFSPAMAKKLGLDKVTDWVVCTTDTMASRAMVQKWANSYNIRYIEAAAEGEKGSATGVAADWNTPEEDNPGYASVPVWIGPCVFSAGIAVAHVLHNTPMGDRTIRLGWEPESTSEPEGTPARFGVYDSDQETIEVDEVEEELPPIQAYEDDEPDEEDGLLEYAGSFANALDAVDREF